MIYSVLDETLNVSYITALKEVVFFGGCEILFLHKMFLVVKLEVQF